MAKWSVHTQAMPKPNTPITVRTGTRLAHAYLRRRHDKRGGWRWWSDSPWNTVIAPAEEGITWCRGHRGPAVDRLAVVASLAPP